MELEQDVGVGGCDVATPELTSKHQTNTALLPVIMPIVVSTIHTNPQNRVWHYNNDHQAVGLSSSIQKQIQMM